MRKIVMVLIMTAIAVMMVHIPANVPLAKDAPAQYEVLSPWAEVDPIPLRGISPRVDTLAGKKIGLFANFKRAAKPICGGDREKTESKVSRHPRPAFSIPRCPM